MKCQKNKACVKQPPNALPDFRKRCTGCDKIGKDNPFMNNKTMKSLIRPMFSSPIMFGRVSKKEVDRWIEQIYDIINEQGINEK
jgi:hypothetical protein